MITEKQIKEHLEMNRSLLNTATSIMAIDYLTPRLVLLETNPQAYFDMIEKENAITLESYEKVYCEYLKNN